MYTIFFFNLLLYHFVCITYYYLFIFYFLCLFLLPIFVIHVLHSHGSKARFWRGQIDIFFLKNYFMFYEHKSKTRQKKLLIKKHNC